MAPSRSSESESLSTPPSAMKKDISPGVAVEGPMERPWADLGSGARPRMSYLRANTPSAEYSKIALSELDTRKK